MTTQSTLTETEKAKAKAASKTDITTKDETIVEVKIKRPEGLYARMLAITAAIGKVKKAGKNTNQNYTYVTEADIKEAARQAMIDYGVYMVTSVKSYEVQEYKSGSGNTRLLAYVTISVVFRSVDDQAQSIPVEYVGCGADGSDKAVNKAITSAVKYALMQMFLIPTGDEVEKDDHDLKGTGKKSGTAAAQEVDTPRPSEVAASMPEDIKTKLAICGIMNMRDGLDFAKKYNNDWEAVGRALDKHPGNPKNQGNQDTRGGENAGS